MKILILAGGKGSRLWPMSREFWPKQFLKINSKSLFEETLIRNLALAKSGNIFVSTNQNYYFYVKEITDQYHIPKENIILEPEARNTAPGILFALMEIEKRVRPDEIITVVPADHFINPVSEYKKSIQEAAQIAQKNLIVIFGLSPKSPETGFGYIKIKNKKTSDCFFKVKQFTEKPDLETAQKFLQSKEYFWNIGIFVFPILLMIEEFKDLAPKIFNSVSSGHYQEAPKIPIDQAIIEKSQKVAMLPVNFEWRDLGNWLAIHQFKAEEENENVKIGQKIILQDSKQSLIIGQQRLIVGLGLEKMVIIDTPDALLISHWDKIGQIKEVTKKLNERKQAEVLEHRTVYRPWGSYTILEEGPNYKVKRIMVKPKKKLSLQLHHHRSEHWITIKGKAQVQIGQKKFDLQAQQSTFVPVETLHRLMNLTTAPVEIIEVQNGDYLGEDDIERFDDDFGRHN